MLRGPKPVARTGCQSWLLQFRVTLLYMCSSDVLQDTPASKLRAPPGTSQEAARGQHPPHPCHPLGGPPAPGHCWDLASTLRDSPHATCAQQPANPTCPFDKRFHTLPRKGFRTTAETHFFHCFCLVLSPQGHVGWLEMGTYHRANTGTWDFPGDRQPVLFDRAVHTGKNRPRSHPGSQSCSTQQ